MKQVNIGIGNGLALFVDDGSPEVTIGFMGTFHIDFSFTTLIDTDGIKADKLQDGIRDGLVLHMGCYTEILQFVIDKDEIIIISLRLDVL